MAISPGRKIAYEVLHRVEAEGAYASDLLHVELARNVKPRDAALATELTLGVLRWRRLLDFLLGRHLKKPVDKLDLPVALSLRLGLYQLRFLERIPARAAVSESAELVKRARKSSAASLVNAVLRRAAEDAKKPTAELLLAELTRAERLAILHSHPLWIVERWLSRLGESRTIALLEANNRTPRLAASLNADQVFTPEGSAVLAPAESKLDDILATLKKSGLHVEPGLLLKSAIAVTGGSPSRTEAFRKGWISIQDEASQAIPLLLGVQPGDSVLDLCAAPGGKTAPLARAAGPEGLVIAADRYAHRLRAARAQFERLGLARVRLIELDGERPLPFRAQFRRILLDAPCSGTGTLARHPEIRWRLRPEQLTEFHRLQVALLGNALAALAPGGRLVYSTCSMEPEENEDVVAEVLRTLPAIRRVPSTEVSSALAPHLAAEVDAANLLDARGYFRTSPASQHTDGFFAALLEKR
jgi:16S rRNA (cytosine967-C5)-methyltransferase